MKKPSPSDDGPVSGSMACSGCGIRPTTLPSALQMPAMSRAEPLGAPSAYLTTTRPARSSSSRVASSATKAPSPFLTGTVSSSPPAKPSVHGVRALLTVSRTLAWMNRRPAFLVSAPGSRCASQRIWKPLQMPSTGSPARAAGISSAITGENLAIAPQRR